MVTCMRRFTPGAFLGRVFDALSDSSRGFFNATV
jgi:hypothetical protein